MTIRRRIIAIIAATAAAVSPALACANFCPQPIADEIAAPAQMPSMMADDCDKMEGATPAGPSQTHDPDCQGCGDCPAVASAKNPALATAGAVSVDAPAMVAVKMTVSAAEDVRRPHRHRVTPPANGPPIAATPVILNDILRL